MCGIAGIRRFDQQPVTTEQLRAMGDRLVHRGPDGDGIWMSEDHALGFAHRRLAIIDVAGSPQPMHTHDNLVHLTFNGEILNYPELRAQLDYPFHTNGDTEVLLAGFAQQGPSWIEELRGQFAFAIYDERDHTLWLARDRLGILPLYFSSAPDQFAFASEIKALLPVLPVPAVDEASLDVYLAHRSVPAPHTLFRGVQKLRPGHWLKVAANGRVEEESYWEVPTAAAPRRSDPARAVDDVHRAMERSVSDALVADVPVGAYLSGGVDSSLIVALAAQTRGPDAPVDTFSAGFGDERFDELPHAKIVSNLLGTRHHEVLVQPDSFAADWSTLTWHRDAPLSEPADVAVFRLAELARQTVKVVLSGEGSDELFAGYPKYRYARATRPLDLVPRRARTALLDTLQRALPARASRPRTMIRALAAPNEPERFRGWFAPFTEKERDALLREIPTDRRGEFAALCARTHGDVIQRMLYVDCHAWLADNLLERGDRMSMAASLELRPPFLDHRVVELAFALPSDVKVRRGETKWVVKQVADRYLPAEIVRRRKVGFRVPLDRWFRSGLRDLAHDRLLDPNAFVNEVFDRHEVRRLLERHDAGRSNEDIRIWTLLGLEMWHDVFFPVP